VIFGFNTDIKIGNAVYHIQTEDRGPSNPVIDTTIYARGRILHRHVTSYKELRESPEFTEAMLRERLEYQHQEIIADLRAGTLVLEHPDAKSAQPSKPAEPAGIQVQLLNPASWITSGTALLQLEVKARGKELRVAGARIEVTLNGAKGPIQFTVQSGRDGRAELSFPVPRISGGGLELIIRASAPAGQDEIRYYLKPKPRSVAP
jgi:hypothetical protein